MLRFATICLFSLIANMSGAQSPDAEGLLQSLLEQSSAEAFERPIGPSVVMHGPHPDARSESWTIVAHLTDHSGKSYSVQIAMARLGLKQNADGPFDVTAVYRGHVIVSSEDQNQVAQERVSRGLGGAGENALSTWIDDWTLSFEMQDDVPVSIKADTSDLVLNLQTRGVASLLLPDDESPLRGYSLPLVRVEGAIDGEPMSGVGWFDHLWGDVPLPGGPLAYDRLVLHLDDGVAVSLLRTRRRDGSGIATLDGALIAPQATPIGLGDENMSFTGDRLVGGGLDLSLDVLDRTATNHFLAPFETQVIRVEGTRDGQPVSGMGTLQLSGEAE